MVWTITYGMDQKEEIMPNPITIVGTGPGDPELISIKARYCLERASLILYDSETVGEGVLRWAGHNASFVNTTSMTVEIVVKTLVKGQRKGEKVAWLIPGDPALDPTISRQIAVLKKNGISFSIIPGIPHISYLGATVQMVITKPGVLPALSICHIDENNPSDISRSLAPLSGLSSPMVLHASASVVDQLIGSLVGTWGKDAPAIVISRIGRFDQQIVRTSLQKIPGTISDAGITGSLIILLGKRSK